MTENVLLKKRYAAEKRFRWYGIASLLLALSFLIGFFYSIISDAAPAFRQTEIRLTITFSPDVIHIEKAKDEEQQRREIQKADYEKLLAQGIERLFPGQNGQKKAQQLLSRSAQYDLLDLVLENPDLIGTEKELWLPAAGEVDSVFQGHNRDATLQPMIAALQEKGAIRRSFNTAMFKNGDSRSPQDAGIKGALKGSFYTLLVTLSLSFPIAVLAAIYLEEFAPKNRFTDFLEANINNLAAVPSIVFGLLGLAVFINFFGMPRSTPLVGGIVLTLMTLPTIIISSRAALKSVPPSIRSAALGLGASKMQVIFHHVLPLALPGMLTGTIIGMAQALGETAPLLMIGMVAFIADPANGILDPATVMPVQIYIWSDLPDRAFVARTSFAILVLLGFLMLMNLTAVLLRKKFERKW